MIPLTPLTGMSSSGTIFSCRGIASVAKVCMISCVSEKWGLGGSMIWCNCCCWSSSGCHVNAGVVMLKDFCLGRALLGVDVWLPDLFIIDLWGVGMEALRWVLCSVSLVLLFDRPLDIWLEFLEVGRDRFSIWGRDWEWLRLVDELRGFDWERALCSNWL